MIKKQNKTLLLTYLPTNLLTSTAFTMAEILLSLTIIGVVAAITLPSLTGNINERTWATQRKALYSRFSQAISLMPTMNNYGVGATDALTIANASEAFVTSGLSKVLKINNICAYGTDGSTLFDCGLPEKITISDGTKKNLPKQFSDLNAGITGTYGTNIGLKNTKAAAFETANGESILTFYNPNCLAANVQIAASASSGTFAPGEEVGIAGKQHVCANFVYDLNGKKGPNTIGKDIGTITVMYSSDSKVVMPMYPRVGTSSNKKHIEAAQICNHLEEGEYRLPNIEEVFSIYTNRLIFGNEVWGPGQYVWAAVPIDSNTAYKVGYNNGIKYPVSRNNPNRVLCVKR